MINLDPYISQAQIGFALMVIAFVIFWRFFVKVPTKTKTSRKEK